MKKSIATIALALIATSAFANEITPQQVCQNMRYSSSSFNKCAVLISRGFFNQGALRVANKLINQSPTRAIEVMEATVGKFVEDEAARVCEEMSYSSINTVECMKTIAGFRIDPSASQVAFALTRTSPSKAVEALRLVADAFIMPAAAAICGQMTYSSSNTLSCLGTIANKIFYNGAEQLCGQQVQYSISKTIKCLGSTGVVYTQPQYPFPTPNQGTVVVETFKLQELRKSISKAKRLLKSGNLQESEMLMNEALRQIKDIHYDNGAY